MSQSETRVRLVTLGSLSILRAADGSDTGLSGVPAVLFAYLVDRRVAQSRADLTALFWPDAEPSKGRHGLRQALSRIRVSVGRDLVVGTDPVAVDHSRIETDVGAFEAAAAGGDIEAALALWKGPHMNGIANGLSWELGEWLALRRRELEAALLDAGRGAVRARMADDDMEGGLALAERLQSCVPADRGLAMDAAEMLLEVGRPHEATLKLEAVGLDSSDARAGAILKRAARTEPEAGDASVGRADESSHDGGAPDAEVAETPPTPPAAAGRPAAKRGQRRTLVALGLCGVAIAAALYGASRPVPLPEASIHFCAQRETQFGFRLDLPVRALDGIIIEPACPIVPLGGDSLLLFRTVEGGGMELVLQTGLEGRVVYRNAGRLGVTSQPFRRAGAMDGVVSPDGRWVLLSVERTDRALERDLSLPELPEEHGLPGVAGLRSDPSYDWDVVMFDPRSGEMRSLGDPGTTTRDARFTPDGDAVVFVSEATGNGDLYRTDLATGVTVQLTNDPRMEREPVVGRRWTVFWIGDGSDEDPEDVGVLENATGEVHLLHAGPWNQAGPDLSPDETRVCWTSKRLGHFEGDIVVADVTGRGEPTTFRSPGREDNCQWLGPDHVLFRSWRTGKGDLFVQGLQRGSEAVNLTVWDDEVNAPFLAVGGGG